MENKKGYVFQPSYFEVLETFPKASDRDALNMAIHRYMFRGEEPVFDNLELKRAWICLYPVLSKSRKTSLGMKKKKAEEPCENLQRTFEEPLKNLERFSEESCENLQRISEESSIKDKDKDKERDTPPTPSKGKRFSPPTLEEVKEHCKSKGYLFSAEAFLAFYSSKGWKVGNQSMKDWRAACTTWYTRDKAENPDKYRSNTAPLYGYHRTDTCPVCGSSDIILAGTDGNCNSCGNGFCFDPSSGSWRQT